MWVSAQRKTTTRLRYELVAARQIIKHAQVGAMPVVIVTHEDVVDPAPIMKVGLRRDEYVTRLSDYQGLQHLLDYLLPLLPQMTGTQPASSPNLKHDVPPGNFS